jgi:hypothetical protein
VQPAFSGLLWNDNGQAFEQCDVAEPLIGADEVVDGGWLLQLESNAELKGIESADLAVKPVIRDEIPGMVIVTVE